MSKNETSEKTEKVVELTDDEVEKVQGGSKQEANKQEVARLGDLRPVSKVDALTWKQGTTRD